MEEEEEEEELLLVRGRVVLGKIVTRDFLGDFINKVNLYRNRKVSKGGTKPDALRCSRARTNWAR